MASRILIRRGTAIQWSSANPTLQSGELGLDTSTQKFKVGDGTNNWNNLPYIGGLESIRLQDLSDVSSTAPALNEVLKWNGSAWAPATAPATDGTGASGTWSISISGNAVTANTATIAGNVANGVITAEKLNSGQTGNAPIFGVRAWGHVQSDVVLASGNVSSFDASTNYIFFTTSLPTAYPAVTCNSPSYGATIPRNITSSSFQIESYSSGGNYIDPTDFTFIVVG